MFNLPILLQLLIWDLFSQISVPKHKKMVPFHLLEIQHRGIELKIIHPKNYGVQLPSVSFPVRD